MCNCIDEESEQVRYGELHRKSVGNAFWNYQVEEELTEEGTRDHHFKGPTAREDLMKTIDMKRAKSPYPHKQCSGECQKRGEYNYCFNMIYRNLYRLW